MLRSIFMKLHVIVWNTCEWLCTCKIVLFGESLRMLLKNLQEYQLLGHTGQHARLSKVYYYYFLKCTLSMNAEG